MSQQFKSSLLILVIVCFLSIVNFAQQVDPGAFGTGSGYTDAEAYWGGTSFQIPLMSAAERKLLSLSPTLKAAHKDFLRQKNTGLFRLLPRDISNPKKSQAGGAYYTFKWQRYGNNAGADLRLENNTLITNEGWQHLGLIVNLGDVSLDLITTTKPEISFLADYVPPKKRNDARNESLRFQQGLSVGSSLYKISLPVSVNNTYVLRSVMYSRSDLLIAFRVIELDGNGGATILWKQLKEHRVPFF